METTEVTTEPTPQWAINAANEAQRVAVLNQIFPTGENLAVIIARHCPPDFSGATTLEIHLADENNKFQNENAKLEMQTESLHTTIAESNAEIARLDGQMNHYAAGLDERDATIARLEGENARLQETLVYVEADLVSSVARKCRPSLGRIDTLIFRISDSLSAASR